MYMYKLVGTSDGMNVLILLYEYEYKYKYTQMDYAAQL